MHGLPIFIDVSSSFLLHLLLVYRWRATVASGVGYLVLYGWAFGDATLEFELCGFVAIKVNTGLAWDDGTERLSVSRCTKAEL